MSHKVQPTPGYGNPHAQEANEVWMPKPSVQSGALIPPGLEYLALIDQLLVKQKVELFEMVSGIETENRYVIKNTMGQTIFKAKEDSNFCARQYCGSNRPFKMKIKDHQGSEVISIVREYHCVCLGPCFSCVDCCLDSIEVKCSGEVVGYVKQLYEGCQIRYSVCNSSGDIVLRIHGPHHCSVACCRTKVPFIVMSADGQYEVGSITKQWSGLAQELFTDADNFGVKFPMDLDVRMKATIIAAVFLIDFMYFEDNANQRRD